MIFLNLNKNKMFSDQINDILIEYTENSSTLNSNLAQQHKILLMKDYGGLQFDIRWKYLQIQSAILNSLTDEDLIIYNIFRTGLKNIVIRSNHPIYGYLSQENIQQENINRQDVNITEKLRSVHITFVSCSPKEVTPYMCMFGQIENDEFCCQRQIAITKNFPALKLEKLSLYPWQKEILCPVYLTTELVEIKQMDQLCYLDVNKCLRKNEKYELDRNCLQKLRLAKYRNATRQVKATNIVIYRHLINKINNILSFYDTMAPGIHGFLVTTTSIILHQALIKDKSLVECLFTAAYHGAGRNRRKGDNNYDQDSANMVLMDEFFPADMRQKMSRRILGLLKDDIYYCYKGADYLNYVSSYYPQSNPLNQMKTTFSISILINDEYVNHQPTLRMELEFLHTIYDLLQNPNFGTEIETIRAIYSDPVKDDIFGFDLLHLYPHLNNTAIQDLGLDIIVLLEFFHQYKYFKDINRIFDDLYTILQAFIPILPIHLRYLAPIFIPFQVHNLWSLNLNF